MSVFSKSKVENMHFMSLRGKRDFRLTWQSRGSAHIYKGAFLADSQVTTKAVVPRDTPLRYVVFAAKTAARLRTRFLLL